MRSLVIVPLALAACLSIISSAEAETTTDCRFNDPGPLVVSESPSSTVIAFNDGRTASLELPGGLVSLTWCTEIERGIVTRMDEESLMNYLVDSELNIIHKFRQEIVFLDNTRSAYAVGPFVNGNGRNPFENSRVSLLDGAVLQVNNAPVDFELAWQYALGNDRWIYVVNRGGVTEFLCYDSEQLQWTHSVSPAALVTRTPWSFGLDSRNAYFALEGYDGGHSYVLALKRASGEEAFTISGTESNYGFNMIYVVPQRDQLLVATTTGPKFQLFNTLNGNEEWAWSSDCTIDAGPFLQIEAERDVVLLRDNFSGTTWCNIEPFSGGYEIRNIDSTPNVTLHKVPVELSPDGIVITKRGY